MNKIALNTLPSCALLKNAAEFSPKTTMAAWSAAGQEICRLHAASNFWIGAWINFGLETFCRKDELGKPIPNDAYLLALQETGLEYQTLRNFAYVERQVDVSRRRDTLLFSHHAEVAPLPPAQQKKWLGLAEMGTDGKRWTVSQLRQAIRGSQSIFRDNEPDPGELPWAKPVGDLFRLLKQEEAKQPLDKWPKERRDAVRACVGREMEYIHGFWQRLQ